MFFYLKSIFRSTMDQKIDLLQLCKGLKRSNKKAQTVFVNNLSHKTLHQISEIFYNIQYMTDIAPPKIRKKLICGMKKNENECRYKSDRHARNVTKKKYLKKQIGTGLFSLILSAAIPILSSIIHSLKK